MDVLESLPLINQIKQERKKKKQSKVKLTCALMPDTMFSSLESTAANGASSHSFAFLNPLLRHHGGCGGEWGRVQRDTITLGPAASMMARVDEAKASQRLSAWTGIRK